MPNDGSRLPGSASTPALTRRQLLGLTGLTAAGVVAGTTLAPAPPAGAATPAYRPVRYNTEADLRTACGVWGDARLVEWPFNTPRSAYIQDALAKLGPNDMLYLPEASQSYYVDSSKGFVVDNTRWYEMARVKRGIVGAGPGTLVEIGPSSFSQPKQLKKDGGCKERVFGCSTPNSLYANFEMRGRDLGGMAYHAMCHNKPGSKIVQVYANAAHRGFRNSPGGESAAFGFNHVDNASILRCEVECRDASGTRVGSSPIMMGWCTNIVVKDCYFHHAYAGMPSMFGSNNGQFTRVRSEFNGSGGSGGTAPYDSSQGWGLNGSCFNFEYCTGTFNLDDCTFICNYLNRTDPSQPVYYGDGNVGAHVGGGAADAPTYINVRRPTFDRGAKLGYFDIEAGPTYLGKRNLVNSSNITVTDANGKAIPFWVRP